MYELGLIAPVRGDTLRHIRSAMPDSPVVPEPEPGRAALATAGMLHRLATRLDHGRPPQLSYGRPG